MTATAIATVLQAHPDWGYRAVATADELGSLINCMGDGCTWNAGNPPLSLAGNDLFRAHQAEELAKALEFKPVELETKPLTFNSTQRPELLDRFTRDMEGGALTLMHDSGLYRHLTFRPAKGNFCWFDIITSPGQLTIRGDMGDYVFAREPDMLRDFFHRNVNPEYWAEKVIAQDVHSPVREYSFDRFKASVLHDFWHAREDYTPADARALWEEIRNTGPLDDYADNQHLNGAVDTLHAFRAESVTGFQFDTHGYEDFEDYGHHFLWCCHAILWAARAYREHDRASK